MENNDRHGIATGSNGNFDGGLTADKRCKLQCTTERNWFYGGDGSRGAFGTGSENSSKQLFQAAIMSFVFALCKLLSFYGPFP